MLASASMDAQQALADLTEISSQIRAAAIATAGGEVLASHGGDGELLTRAARDLLAAAEELRPESAPTQIEAATTTGSLFVVRDGEHLIAATTGPEPTVGLVFYDLKSALRAAAPGDVEKPKRRRRRKDEHGDTDETA